MDPEGVPLFTFFHINDAYNVEPSPQGDKGVINFEAYVRKLRQQFPSGLLVHSGDAFSPSNIGRMP